MKISLEKIITKIIWLPFVLGFIGYGIIGHLTFWNAIYASAALYFVNPVSDIDNVFTLIAKLLAVLIITSIVLTFIESLSKSLNHFYKRFFRDSTAIYSDNEKGITLANNVKHGYLNSKKNKKIDKTNYHIIMYSNDLENINLFNYNEINFKDSKVFIMLTQIDFYLLKSLDEQNVYFFNPYENIARDYWKEYNLFSHIEKDIVKIAIIGFDNIGQILFKYGYLNNIYNLNQRIEYHIWDINENDMYFYENLKFQNEDSIYIYSNSINKNIKLLTQMDRVIIADESKLIDNLQLLINQNKELNVHCFSENNLELKDIFDGDNIVTFGRMDKYLTKEYVIDERGYYLGKLFNYDYFLRNQGADLKQNYEIDMQKSWDKLNGFKKGSSIARADHYWIVKKLEKLYPNMNEENYLKLEHIRWCRFHYYNNWSYGVKRDDKRKKHNLLIDYELMPLEQKKKDGIYSKKIQRLIDESVKI